MSIEIPDTPCVVAEWPRVKRNIVNMQEAADRLGCALRPHIKTHKSIEIAKMQLAAGAAGVTCAKTSEAEVFADVGIDDIFIAYPLIGVNKLKRAAAIQHKMKRLIVAVDSVEGARAMSDFCAGEGLIFETRVEIDTGAGRTGTALDKLRVLGEELRKLPGLRVTGVYTFKSMVLEGKPTADAQAAGQEEGRMMAEAAGILRGLGFDIQDISAGSTPTGLAVAATGHVNEIRPGTYVFHDWATLLGGACAKDDIAAYVLATVVSTPAPHIAIVDAGTKTLAADMVLHKPPFPLAGYARIAASVPPAPAAWRDDLILDRANEEHGIIRAANGQTGLRVGDMVKLVPAHICTVINLRDFIYAWDGESYRKIPINARGKVW